MATLSKTITGTAIAILLAGAGATGDYYLSKDIQLANERFTGYEYSQLKPALVNRVKERNTKRLSHREVELWQAAWNRENEKCKFSLNGITEKNIVDKLNDVLEKGC